MKFAHSFAALLVLLPVFAQASPVVSAASRLSSAAFSLTCDQSDRTSTTAFAPASRSSPRLPLHPRPRPSRPRVATTRTRVVTTLLPPVVLKVPSVSSSYLQIVMLMFIKTSYFSPRPQGSCYWFREGWSGYARCWSGCIGYLDQQLHQLLSPSPRQEDHQRSANQGGFM